MTRFWAILRNTFAQTIRQPIYGILILCTFMVLLLPMAIGVYTVAIDYHASDQKMVESLGLSTLLVSGLLVAAFSASSVLSREIEDRTALTVISKPVSRATFVISKFAGVWAAVAVAFYLCTLAFLLLIRHRAMPALADPYDWPVIVLGASALVLSIAIAMAGNYFFGWHFVSASVWSALVLLTVAMSVVSFIGKGWEIVPLGYDKPDSPAITGQLLVGVLLISMAVTVFVAVAVAASTRLGQVMTLLACCAVFAIGSAHPYLFGYWQDEILAARVAGWVAPNLTYFFPIDALANEQIIPAGRVAAAAGYCGLYVAATLAVGMAMFERRQLEAQSGSSTMPGAVSLLAWTGRAASIVGTMVAVVLVSLPGFHNLAGLGTVAGILVAAAVNWLLWDGFGRGAAWAYWLAGLLAVSCLTGLLTASILPERLGLDPSGSAHVAMTAGAGLAAVVVLILLLPRTRRHFR